MCLLSSSKRHNLIEADGFWMFEPKDAKPIELGGQQTCARSDCGSRHYKHQHALTDHPAITVLQEHQLHPFITVRPKLCVIGRIQVQERACFRQHPALKGAAVNGRYSLLGGGRSSVRVELDTCQVRVRILCDLK